MRQATVIGVVFLLAFAAQAQDHCPPGGAKKEGTTPSISWSSYMVNTSGGICVERTVHTSAPTFVNWPVADMYNLWVVRDWTAKRCCFPDSVPKDGDLEYGVLGQKLHTTVYRGSNELAQGTTLHLFGSVRSGNGSTQVDFSGAAQITCAQGPNGACRVELNIVNSRSPVILEWGDALIPEFQPSEAAREFVVKPGTNVTLRFRGGSDPLTYSGLRVMTTDHVALAGIGKSRGVR